VEKGLHLKITIIAYRAEGAFFYCIHFLLLSWRFNLRKATNASPYWAGGLASCKPEKNKVNEKPLLTPFFFFFLLKFK